ncbi:hypothetical protein [Fangia hongkongensis]|uniref:hypothetical protein n=1 Tax=Fangia hongkongensis TaxID=270495 RepID=UPI00035F45E2|nr:hypothetical protein [Fangia hongkongensis]MBK2124412.1 hypothetical protein [Fangia hongkongensis]
MASEAVVYIESILKILGGSKINLFTLIRVIATIIGFVLLFIALIRLSKHGKTQQMFRYYAPITTAMMFFSGVILISSTGFIQMITITVMPTTSLDPTNAISAYITQISNLGVDSSTIAQKYLIFALLNIIGFIALIKGMFLLIKVGEGQQEGGVAQIISYFVAGIIGMNLEFCLAILQGIYHLPT